MNPLSTIFINLALIFYSIGVWAEKITGRLKLVHLLFFWAGLVFDTLGTTMMMEMSKGFNLNFHGLTGALAIILMGFHAIWATLVLISKKESAITNFHKFSLCVWIIWLIPFISGMVMGMIR
jgi:uncharacterized repeat protein (TIGR03987 family)